MVLIDLVELCNMFWRNAKFRLLLSIKQFKNLCYYMLVYYLFPIRVELNVYLYNSTSSLEDYLILLRRLITSRLYASHLRSWLSSPEDTIALTSR